jgi:hypothetical protein
MNLDQSCDHKGIIAQVGVVIQSFPNTVREARDVRWCWVVEAGAGRFD